MERYVLNTDKETMQDIFGVHSTSQSILTPTYNAAPGHLLPIIFSNQGMPVLKSAIWGLEKAKTTITALDIDDVIGDNYYKSLLKTNACIIPINGFYKWKKSVNDPLPFFTRIHTHDLLGIAGFYIENDDYQNSFCVITKDANVLIKPLDESMPCILDPKNFRSWLTGDAENQLRAGFKDISLLPEMTVFRVPDLVNDLSKNSPDLMQPIPKLREDD